MGDAMSKRKVREVIVEGGRLHVKTEHTTFSIPAAEPTKFMVGSLAQQVLLPDEMRAVEAVLGLGVGLAAVIVWERKDGE